MRKLISINQVSLDGIMQSPGGPQEDPRGGFELGGWIVPYRDEDMAEQLNRTVSGSFDLLLGRPHLGGRAVGGDAIGVAAPQSGHGQPRDLADQIPQRHLHAVDGCTEDLRVADHGHQALDVGGVLADEVRRHEALDGDGGLQARVSRADSEDVVKGNNHWSRQDFDSKAPGLEWQAYFSAAGLDGQKRFVVWHPSAVTGLSALAIPR